MVFRAEEYLVWTRFACLLSALVTATGLLALDPAAMVTQYGIDLWTGRDGLPQNSIRVIRQSSDGYMWLGTRAGLVRFDGVTFTVFDSSNTPALVEDHILALATGADGTVWAGSTGGEIVSIKGHVFEQHTFAALERDTIRSLAVDRSGRLWIGSEKQGLFRLERGVLTAVPTGPTPADKCVRVLYEDRRDRLWAGTDAGLFLVDEQGSASAVPIRWPGARFAVWAITGDGSGGLFVGTRLGGLFQLDGVNLRSVRLEPWLHNRTILSLTRDHDGNLWIGSDGDGLGRLTSGRLDPVTNLSGLSNQIVRAVYEDREGGIWVGAAGGGLTRLRDQPLSSLTMREGMPTDMFRSAFSDRDGAVWLGSAVGIIRVKEGRIDVYDERHGLPGPLIWPVWVDADRNLWAGSSQGRLIMYPGGRIHRANAQVLLNGVQVRVLHQTRDGSVWIGTARGLFCFPKGASVTARNAATEVLVDKPIAALLESRDGRLWVGTSQGLYLLQSEGFTAVELPGFRSKQVIALHEDAEGNIWVATPKGLGLFRQGRAQVFDRSAGIPDTDIYGFAEDGQGGFWITGRTGLCRVPAQQMRELARGARSAVAARTFSTGDSLRGGAEFNWGVQPLMTSDPNGRVWIPSYGGMLVTNPAKVDLTLAPPPVYVERVLVDDRPIAADAPAGHRLDIYYTALTYSAPQSVRFRYMLEGFDKDWVDGGNRRHAFYTAVPPGKFVFRVQAASYDGLWSSEVAAWPIEFTPRFYQSWWFFGLCTTAGVLAIIAVHAARVRGLRRRETELAQRVADRTAELQAEILERCRAEHAATCASRAKSDFLANMSHEIRTPMNAVIGMTELVLDSSMTHQQRQQVEIVKDSAESLLNLLNEVLDFSKIEAGKLELNKETFSLRETVAAAVKTVSARGRQKGLRLSWVVDHTAPDSLIGDSSRLRQVLLNILGNAVKFTDSGEVSVEVRSSPGDAGMLLFEVSDTGIGIAPEQQQRIFEAFTQADDSAVRKNGGTGLGLAISSQLLRLLGGDISVTSQPGEGSTFRFHARFEPSPLQRPASLTGQTLYIASGHERSRRSLAELARYWGMIPVGGEQTCDVAIIDLSDPADWRYGANCRSLAIAWAELAGRTPPGFEGSLMKPVGPNELYRFLGGVENSRVVPQPGPRRALRILVAEDNLVNQKITRAMLEREGYTVTVAADGRKAVDAVERERFDVVLMDLQMPELDGIEATDILRERGYTLPILALTACAGTDDAEKCLAAGMNGHLAKPIRRAELLLALEGCTRPPSCASPVAVTLPA